MLTFDTVSKSAILKFPRITHEVRCKSAVLILSGARNNMEVEKENECEVKQVTTVFASFLEYLTNDQDIREVLKMIIIHF